MGQLQVPTNSPLHLDAGDKGESDKGQVLEATAQGFWQAAPFPILRMTPSAIHCYKSGPDQKPPGVCHPLSGYACLSFSANQLLSALYLPCLLQERYSTGVLENSVKHDQGLVKPTTSPLSVSAHPPSGL